MGSSKFTLLDAVTSLHVIVELRACSRSQILEIKGRRWTKERPLGSGEAAGPVRCLDMCDLLQIETEVSTALYSSFIRLHKSWQAQFTTVLSMISPKILDTSSPSRADIHDMVLSLGKQVNFNSTEGCKVVNWNSTPYRMAVVTWSWIHYVLACIHSVERGG